MERLVEEPGTHKGPTSQRRIPVLDLAPGKLATFRTALTPAKYSTVDVVESRALGYSSEIKEAYYAC